MSTTDLENSGQYDSKADSDKTKPDFVARWMAEIDLASKAEEPWRKDAEHARQIYRAEKDGESKRFNIEYSNVQTAVPALYNSTPTPDVRTRYSDENEVSRLSCQSIERVLSHSVDTYNFDGTIKSAVQDRELAGRGQVRVRYAPYMYDGKLYQEVSCEHVPWKHYRQGPAMRWEDVPWIAFEQFLTREQLVKLSPELGNVVELDFSVAQTSKEKADAAPNVYKRARVWEIWDKATRKVIWIAPAYKDAPIREDDDPLELMEFFPVPEPLYAIRTSDSMVPVCPYKIIRPLADELEEITIRIQALVRVCKWRGIRHPAIPSFELLEEAKDGELVAPVDGSETLGLVQAGGLDKYVWLMPVDQVIKVLQQLYVQREQIKQTIFEVSGLSDILRGQTDPDETLGAQEIKANFGTMRLQDAQKDVQRFCRDLFRLKAEIACEKFDSENLAMMTGLNLPSRQQVQMAQAQLKQMEMQAQAQPPAGMGHNGGPPMQQAPQQPPPELVDLAKQTPWEDVLETLKSGMLRSYRIDVETDSTIRGDVRQAQQSAATFLEGSAKFFQGVGPAVQLKFMPADVAIDIYSGFTRLFKLGKQAEDALARWSADAQEQAKNPQPEPPSPEELKAKAEQEKAKMQMGMAQQKHQMDMTKLQATLAADQQKTQMELGARQREIELEAERADMEMVNDMKKAYMDFEIHQQQAQFDMQNAERQAAMDAQTQARKAHFDERKAVMSERMAMDKHKRAMSQPAAGRA